jgi:hypothetical protein
MYKKSIVTDHILSEIEDTSAYATQHRENIIFKGGVMTVIIRIKYCFHLHIRMTCITITLHLVKPVHLLVMKTDIIFIVVLTEKLNKTKYMYKPKEGLI